MRDPVRARAHLTTSAIVLACTYDDPRPSAETIRAAERAVKLAACSIDPLAFAGTTNPFFSAAIAFWALGCDDTEDVLLNTALAYGRQRRKEILRCVSS